jgi:hypothetical protein
VPIDFVEIGLALDVVVRVLHEVNEGALLPLLEHEGASADWRIVGRIGFVIRAGIDVFGHHGQRADLENAYERPERLLQREHYRVLVGRLDLLDDGEVAAGARMGLFQEIE